MLSMQIWRKKKREKKRKTKIWWKKIACFKISEIKINTEWFDGTRWYIMVICFYPNLFWDWYIIEENGLHFGHNERLFSTVHRGGGQVELELEPALLL